MADDLIINARRKLSWRRRIGSDAATALLWAVWIYLCWPVIEKLYEVVRLQLALEPAAIEVLETADPISLQHSLVALIGTCAALMLWTLMPKRKVTHPHTANTLDDYAETFAIPADSLDRAQHSRITTVHCDEEGEIVQLEIESPADDHERR